MCDMCKAVGYKLSLEDIEAHSLFDKEDNKKLLCMFTKKSDFMSMLESGGIDAGEQQQYRSGRCIYDRSPSLPSSAGQSILCIIEDQI